MPSPTQIQSRSNHPILITQDFGQGTTAPFPRAEPTARHGERAVFVETGRTFAADIPLFPLSLSMGGTGSILLNQEYFDEYRPQSALEQGERWDKGISTANVRPVSINSDARLPYPIPPTLIVAELLSDGQAVG